MIVTPEILLPRRYREQRIRRPRSRIRRVSPLGLATALPFCSTTPASDFNAIAVKAGATVLQCVQSDIGVTQTGTVSNWADLSGNGFDFSQATGAKQYAYTASGLNGLPIIQATGTSQVMVSNLTRGVASSNPTTIMAVYRTDTWHAVGAADIIWTENTVGALGLRLNYASTTPQITQQCGATSAANSGAAVGTWVIVEEYVAGSAASYLQLGATRVTGDIGNNAVFTTGAVLGYNGSGRTAIHSLAMRIVMAGNPTTAIADLRTAITAKYGVS